VRLRSCSRARASESCSSACPSTYVQELVGTEIDLHHVNDLGWTALLEAVILGDGGIAHQEIVRMLVEAGANVDIADRDGVTPLEHTRRSGYAEIVQILSKPETVE
jgi:uncharacterized protein